MLYLGIAGKIRSGKSTLARALAVHTNGFVLHLSSSFKGSSHTIPGIGTTSWFPQLHTKSRKWLQNVGTYGIQHIRPEVWIEALQPVIKQALQQGYHYDTVIIGDIRFPHEIVWIKNLGGFIIYTQSSQEEENKCEIHQHISENSLQEKQADLIVPFVSIYERVNKIIEFLKMHGKICLSRLPRIYISMPMTYNLALAEKWYNFLLNHKHPYSQLVHYLTPKYQNITDEEEHPEEYVIQDLEKVSQADAIIQIVDRPSVGCSMELTHAKLSNKLTVTISAYNSGWLKVHSDIFDYDPGLDQVLSYGIEHPERQRVLNHFVSATKICLNLLGCLPTDTYNY